MQFFVCSIVVYYGLVVIRWHVETSWLLEENLRGQAERLISLAKNSSQNQWPPSTNSPHSTDEAAAPEPLALPSPQQPTSPPRYHLLLAD
eukprot:scaffold100775_cov72-Cyclotella_meneghiniana.AAC.8